MLDHKKFDKIYEVCKDGERYEGSNFSSRVFRAHKEIYDEYYCKGLSFSKLELLLLEAYRSGEIRDAGPYPQKPTESITITYTPETRLVAVEVYDPLGTLLATQYIPTREEIGWVSLAEIQEPPWYKLPADVFDPLVDDHVEFMEEVKKYQRLWESFCFSLQRGDDYTSTLESSDATYLVRAYVSGILRDKGPMPEKKICSECGQDIEDNDER